MYADFADRHCYLDNDLAYVKPALLYHKQHYAMYDSENSLYNLH